MEVEKFYLLKGEEMIDNLYDKGYFSSDVSRLELRNLDELLGWFFQSYAESAVRREEVV